jgi:hypothetical protein
MGNSQAVAAKHYLQVTEEHFRAAAGEMHNTMHVPSPLFAMSRELKRLELSIRMGAQADKVRQLCAAVRIPDE